MSSSSNSKLYLLIASFLLAAIVGIVQLATRPAPQAEADAGEAFRELSKHFEDKDKPGIAVIHVDGAIKMEQDNQGFSFKPGGSDYIVKQIHRFAKDTRVEALVLRVNSPGGTVGASQEIYQALLDFKASGKKVVVSMGDLAASGGYYISAPADYIFANPGSIVGSIGVIIGNYNVMGLAEKLGVKMQPITSGAHKDILSPWREMSEQERTMIQALVDQVFEQFFGVVAKHRPIEEAKLREIADGRLFSGEEAKNVGLVDGLGDFTQAKKKAWALAGHEGDDVHIVKMPKIDLEDFLGQWMSQMSGPQNLSEFLHAGSASARTPVTLLYPGVI